MPAMWELVAHPRRHHAADVIERILHHLDLPTEPPSSSRAPPAQVDLPWDDLTT
jgi:hypothetical protein